MTLGKTTKGAWLLAQSKNLDAVTGIGAAQLENISYAGHIGRLYNLLRRNLADDPNPTILGEPSSAPVSSTASTSRRGMSG